MATKAKEPVTQEPDTLALWNAVSKTDPAHTKKVNQRGGFTAISAHYQVMQATRQFGPVGIGWGYLNGDPIISEGVVIVPVTLWHGERANSFGPIYGGADLFDSRGKVDSDAPKKAATDGLTKGLSHLGFNADVFLGRFDDNKYVEQVRAEFAQAANDEPPAIGAPPPRTKLEGPFSSKTALKKAIHEIHGKIAVASSTEEVDSILRAGRDTIKQAEHDWPELLNGNPDIPEDVGLKGAVAIKREALAEDGSFGVMLESLNQCETLIQLTNWMAANEAMVEALDDLHRRKFEAARDQREAAIMEMDKTHA